MGLYRVAPHPLWGWDSDMVVEIEQVSDSRTSLRSMVRVLVDREPVGFVFGREDHTGRSKEWGYVLGTEAPTWEQQRSFPSRTRLAAVTALVKALPKRGS